MSIHQKLYFWVENKIEICTTKVVYHRIWLYKRSAEESVENLFQCAF